MSLEAEMRNFPDDRAALERIADRRGSGAMVEWAREAWAKEGPVFYAIHAEIDREVSAAAEQLHVAALGAELLEYLRREALEQKLWQRVPVGVTRAYTNAQKAKLIPPDWHQDEELALLLNKYRKHFGSRLAPVWRIAHTARSEADANRNPS